MKTTFTGRSSLSLLLCLTGLLFIATPKARADQGDPPTRVARISYVDGSVSMQPGGSGDWGAAAMNRPVTIGDKIWSDKDSRAELQAGQAAIHLGGMTALSFLNLDENIIQMRLAEGSVNFRVRELRQGDLYEVDAPNLAFTVKQAGAFRIDVDENGDSSRVTVIRGEGEVTAGGKTYEVHAGERAEFNGAETAIGAMSRNTDTCGIPVTLTWAGRPTAWVIGIGWVLGAGAGLTLNPGGLLPSTTVAGIISVAGGAGARGRSSGPQFTALRSLVSLAAGASDSVLAAESAGSRWDLGNRSFPVFVAAAGSSRGSTSVTPSFGTPTSSTQPTFIMSISSMRTIQTR